MWLPVDWSVKLIEKRLRRPKASIMIYEPRSDHCSVYDYVWEALFRTASLETRRAVCPTGLICTGMEHRHGSYLRAPTANSGVNAYNERFSGGGSSK
jgi:hypothetical protein